MIWFHDMSTLDSFNGLGKYLNAEKSKSGIGQCMNLITKGEGDDESS